VDKQDFKEEVMTEIGDGFNIDLSTKVEVYKKGKLTNQFNYLDFDDALDMIFDSLPKEFKLSINKLEINISFLENSYMLKISNIITEYSDMFSFE